MAGCALIEARPRVLYAHSDIRSSQVREPNTPKEEAQNVAAKTKNVCAQRELVVWCEATVHVEEADAEHGILLHAGHQGGASDHPDRT